MKKWRTRNLLIASVIFILTSLLLAGTFQAGEEEPDYSSEEDSCVVYPLFYGDKSFLVEALGGTKVTLKIGKETKKVSFDADGQKKITVKKLYKLGTKIKASFDFFGHTFTKNVKVEPNTSLNYAKAKGKKLKVEIYNAHKGDKLTVKYKGRKYTVKVKKNYNKKNHWFTIKLKKKMKSDCTFTIKIQNKFKQKLYQAKVTMQDGAENGIDAG